MGVVACCRCSTGPRPEPAAPDRLSRRVAGACDNHALTRTVPAGAFRAGFFIRFERHPAMSDNNSPVFQIQRVYMKEASLEQPNSPAILLEQEQPSVDIQLGIEAAPAADGVYEVCITATVTTKVKDKTVFLVEAK